MNAHDASVALFVRGLGSLKVLLTKGEAHATASKLDPLELLHTELAPGMYDLLTQAHWAAEGARIAVARLTGASATPSADAPKSFADLHRRIDAVVAELGAAKREDLERGLERTIEIEHRSGSMKFVGEKFLLEFAIPNFFFHLTTAYCILRHRGVQLTKGDFLG
jgi:uncharacterized protein